MRDSRRLILPVLALAGVALALAANAVRPAPAPASGAEVGGARFRLHAPAARRLVDLVDGLVDVRVGPTGQPGTLGLTESGGPRYQVTVDLGRVAAIYGRRGIDRVVLHELGHVVDHALVPDDAMARLEAGIPAGYGWVRPGHRRGVRGAAG